MIASNASTPCNNVPLDTDAFVPSVHWAEHQRIPSQQGGFRRLYDGELMYVYSGSMAVEFQDTEQRLVYHAGDLLVLPPAVRHRTIVLPPGPAHLLGIHFDLYDELDLEIVGDMVVVEANVCSDYFCRWPVLPDGSPAFSRCYRSIPKPIASWMEELQLEQKIQRPGYQTASQGYMQLILTALLRLQQDMNRSIAPAYQSALLKLVEQWHQNLHLPYTNTAMAHRLNISEDYYIRLFKLQFDKSPQQYLMHIRHQAAKRYLRETDYKIEQIGALIGYDDLHNFSHAFKKWQGVSPRAYRNMFQIV
ncbi:helix-turn-helix domain-containing protein [Paenibacillus eucommiae]|uniref:AraC-like DNA-binding protein n=1 Tax=Paenibacillus eucommiae TaxID=1355755 RepID=A0ABS4IPM1_9BACL|nr:AraC family transcriptional regulator [Paenibacillus eucommiae]MBP1989458.1 AraC-like DNA-binding protein [Paenibacillus eucommiae]